MSDKGVGGARAGALAVAAPGLDRAMSAFSVVSAALEGFRFTREHPRALLPWAALSFVLTTAIAVVTVATGAERAATELGAMSARGGAPDLPAVASAMVRIAPALAVSAVLWWAASSVMLASVFRGLLAPGKVGLRLGMDEVRVGATLFFLFGLQFAASVAVSLMLAAVVAVSGGGGGAATPAAGAAEFASGGLIALLMVRFALAPAIAVAEGRLGLAASLRRTRGRFWPLIGALVLAAMLAGVVALVANLMFLMLAGAAVAAGGQPATAIPALLTPRDESLAALFAPGVLAVRLFQSLLLAAALPLLAGPVAAAYRATREGGPKQDPLSPALRP